MRLYKTAIFAGAVLAGAAVSATVFAHSGATGIVGERMGHMEMLGDAVKQLTAMFAGQTPYDAAKARQLSNVIKDHSGASMTALFPEGSNEPPSEAKPEIWKDWKTFEVLADQLETFSAGLAMASDNPRGGMSSGGATMGQSGQGMMGQGMMGGIQGATPQHSADTLGQMPPDMVFGMVTRTCSACHTRFRAEKD